MKTEEITLKCCGNKLEEHEESADPYWVYSFIDGGKVRVKIYNTKGCPFCAELLIFQYGRLITEKNREWDYHKHQYI